jgi:hypothetical protein
MDDVYPEDYVTKTFSIGFALLFCTTLPAADFSPLDVKTGQWESTVTGQTTGLPPIPDDVLNRIREGMKSTGTVKVEAVDSENIKGSMQMTVTNGEHTLNMNYIFASKWIGPVCAEK